MRLVVLGDPVAHSLSPVLHRAALGATGIQGDYTARRVDAEGMAAAAAEIRSGELDGANITMPHKRLALELADELTAPARRTGAVNTWVRVDGRIVGHNTDIAGVLRAWEWAGLPETAPVLIVGNGGAAAAAAVALEGRTITVAGRRPGAAAELLEAVRVEGEPAQLPVALSGAVVVNATPLGMKGEELPESMLHEAAGLLDMAYGPEVTPAVAWCRRYGIPCAPGPSMLLGQAVEAFRLWTGHAPAAAMRDALAAAGVAVEAVA